MAHDLLPDMELGRPSHSAGYQGTSGRSVIDALPLAHCSLRSRTKIASTGFRKGFLGSSAEPKQQVTYLHYLVACWLLNPSRHRESHNVYHGIQGGACDPKSHGLTAIKPSKKIQQGPSIPDFLRVPSTEAEQKGLLYRDMLQGIACCGKPSHSGLQCAPIESAGLLTLSACAPDTTRCLCVEESLHAEVMQPDEATLSRIMEDSTVMEAFYDPAVMSAVAEIAHNPEAYSKHAAKIGSAGFCRISITQPQHDESSAIMASCTGCLWSAMLTQASILPGALSPVDPDLYRDAMQ